MQWLLTFELIGPAKSYITAALNFGSLNFVSDVRFAGAEFVREI